MAFRRLGEVAVVTTVTFELVRSVELELRDSWGVGPLPVKKMTITDAQLNSYQCITEWEHGTNLLLNGSTY